MRKILAVLAVLVCLPLSVGCHWIPFAFLFMNMGTEYETDIAKYGQEDEYVKEQLICL